MRMGKAEGLVAWMVAIEMRASAESCPVEMAHRGP